MTPDRPVADLVGLSRGSRSAILKALKEAGGRNRDARDLFLEADGTIKPAAERLIGRLAKEAGMTRFGFEPDPRQQDYRLGMQHMVRFLADMLRLDTARIEELQRRLEKAQ